MSGLSNWSLNQRINSVAARIGTGSSTTTIGEILVKGNDANEKTITNLSEIESAEVTTPLIKSTEPIVLQSGDNTVTIGTDGKLTLPNPSGAGILCKDSSNIVEKVTVGSNLDYNTTSKELDTANELTGLTSISTGKLSLTDTTDNIEGAILNNPKITGLESAGIYSIDSNGYFSKVYFAGGLSYTSGITNTITYTSLTPTEVFSPKIDNALVGNTDTTAYWNADCFSIKRGNILKLKGLLEGTNTIDNVRPRDLGQVCMSLPVEQTYEVLAPATPTTNFTILSFNTSSLSNATNPPISPSDYHNFINVKVGSTYLNRDQYSFTKSPNLEITFTSSQSSSFTLELPYLIKNHNYYEPIGTANYKSTSGTAATVGQVFASRTSNTNLLQFITVNGNQTEPFNDILEINNEALNIYFNCEVEIIP